MVVDASVIVDYLLVAPGVEGLRQRFREAGGIHVPYLLDLEVIQVLRRQTLHKALDSHRASEALADFAALPLIRHPHHIYAPRIWELRNNLSAYDAAYVVLAEALRAPLLTRDRRLASAAGHRARIEIV